MFESWYESPWHNPAFFWLTGVLFLAWWMRRQPFLTGFFALFTVEILADALATGGWSPLSLLKSPASTPVAIAFVILGDFRYFLLTERYAVRPEAKPRDATAGKAWATSIGLSFIVPVLAAITGRLVPAKYGEGRWAFLTYEVIFLALSLALRFVVYPRRLAGTSTPVKQWLRRVTTFEVVQYALWASADVLIFAGLDAGFALRFLPNAMYYVAFLPFVALTAPREAEG